MSVDKKAKKRKHWTAPVEDCVRKPWLILPNATITDAEARKRVREVLAHEIRRRLPDSTACS